MIDLDEFSILPTRHGPAQGKAVENRLIDAVGGPGTIRKRFVDNADGSRTMAHTRGPGAAPEIITEKKTVSVTQEIRTFVFNIYTALTAVVANYRVTLTNALKIGPITATYSVFPYRTNVGKRLSTQWNDVCRLDHDADAGLTTVKVNSQSDFLTPGVNMQIPYAGPAALPHFIIENGRYGSALGADINRSPLFVGTAGKVYSYNSVKTADVLGLGPDAYQIREYITPSYAALMNPVSSSGVRLEDHGIFTFSGSTLLPEGNDPDTIDSGAFAWSKIRVAPTDPFLQEIAAWGDGWSLGARTIARVPAMTYDEQVRPSYAEIPVFYGSKSWYYFGKPATWWPQAKYLEVDYGVVVAPTNRTKLTQTRADATVDKTFRGSSFAGSGVELITTFSVAGGFHGEKSSGTVTTWWEGSGVVGKNLAAVTSTSPVTVYYGDAWERRSNSHSVMTMKASAELPTSVLFRSEVTHSAYALQNDYHAADTFETGVYGANTDGILNWFFYNTFPQRGNGWEAKRRSLWGQNLLNPADPAHPENPAINAERIALVDSYNGIMVDQYPAFPMMTHHLQNTTTNTLAFYAEAVDYVYADIDEGVFIYLHTALSYNYSTVDGVSTGKAYSLTAEYVLATRHGGGVFPVGNTSIDEPFVSLLTNFVSPGEGLGLGGGIGAYHAHFLPIPIFAPVFVEQGNCPWVSYTTKAEEYAGTAPEIHIDMTLQAAKYSTWPLYAGMRYSGTVGFVPHQFLNLYQRYLKQPGPPTKNYGLFAQMFGTPTRVQFSNVGGGPFDFSSDIKLQLSRI